MSYYNFEKRSTFTGKTFGFMGIYFLVVLLSSLTMGIGAPWASCMYIRWIVKHSVIDGKRLEFKGTGGRLLGKMILWSIIPILFGAGATVLLYFFPNQTLAILLFILLIFFVFTYTFWVMVQEMKWYVKNIHFVDEKENGMDEDDVEYYGEIE